MAVSHASPPGARIGPIARDSLRERVQARIIDRILTGALPAGSRINESHLAKALGVSQTPVREALTGLEGQGFVVARPARGFFVEEFSEREARDIYSVLAELEAMSLEAAGLPGPKLLSELARIDKEFDGVEGKPDRSIKVDDRFHSRLLSGCPNRYLLRLANQTRRAAYRYEYAYMGEAELICASSDHHGRIVSFLRRGRLEEAANQLRRAWLASIDDIVRWLERRNRSDPHRGGAQR